MNNFYRLHYPITGFFVLMLSGMCFTQSWGMEGQSITQQPGPQTDIHAASPSSNSQYMNVEGTLKEIQGNLYVLEGPSNEQAIRVQVGKDTAFPNGPKELGQTVQALVSAQNGHALIIR
jgi:hypothetical protein